MNRPCQPEHLEDLQAVPFVSVSWSHWADLLPSSLTGVA